MRKSDTFMLFLFFAIIALVGYGLLRTFFPTLVISARPYRCEASDNDPEGYLVKICEYVKENDIRSRAGDPTLRTIATQEEYEDPPGRTLIQIHLDCCGDFGDIAIIDKATGEVIDYMLGNFTY